MQGFLRAPTCQSSRPWIMSARWCTLGACWAHVPGVCPRETAGRKCGLRRSLLLKTVPYQPHRCMSFNSFKYLPFQCFVNYIAPNYLSLKAPIPNDIEVDFQLHCCRYLPSGSGRSSELVPSHDSVCSTAFL
jgi:hypothetical protein